MGASSSKKKKKKTADWTQALMLPTGDFRVEAGKAAGRAGSGVPGQVPPTACGDTRVCAEQQ
ncbi:hypothetical protein GJAV_G00115460 [Gymnothorax javanicus]|nr:hypothetical protein GJAV_G00115460 [Gymnothorax javanicus]